MRILRTAIVPVLALAMFLLPESAIAGARPAPCPNILPPGQCPADVGTALAECCPCDNFSNHGRYVRCVAHATNALRRDGCLDKDQRRSLKRCAARSTCSKPEGFVTCCIEKPDSCTSEGVCAHADPEVTCVADEDCPPRTKCRLKRGAQKCLDRGGTPGTGSCCNACAAPAP